MGVFYAHYAFIDSNLYECRDDGVITMSAGRHIVDYGFVGVSPSGPIVEASSSPLQTIVYAIVYATFGINYHDYSILQTYVCSFLLGTLFAAFFNSHPPFAVIFSSALLATLLSFTYPFFLWHASGMENSLTHVFYLATVLILYRSVRCEKIRFIYIIPFFLASIVRIESVIYISIALLYFSFYWWNKFKSPRGFFFSLSVTSMWCLFQAARLLYFGDITPNTSYAQNISVGSQLESFMFFDLDVIRNSLARILPVFILQGLWVAIIFLPVYYLTQDQPSYRFLLFLILLLSISISLSPALFGYARIDPTRITTQSILLAWVGILFSILHTRRAKFVSLYSALGISAVLFYNILETAPYYLGWRTLEFDRIRLQFQEIAQAHDIRRPTISNPDLGVMTWHKQFNVIDLGMLGTPEMAKLGHRPDLALGEWFLEYGLPDIIESHENWTKRYCKSIFLTDKFNELYAGMGNNHKHPKELCSTTKRLSQY